MGVGTVTSTPHKFWLALTDDDNWEIIKSNGIYAVKSVNQYNKLCKGDRLVIYLIPKRICALYEIESLSSSKNKKFKSDDFKYYFDIKPILILDEPVKITNKLKSKKIVDNLSIFKGTIRWGTVLMGRSIIEITQSDYDYLEKVMKKYAPI